MKKTVTIGIILLVFTSGAFAEGNPFAVPHSWLLRSVYGTEICTLLFTPVIGPAGSLYVFPAGWDKWDDFYRGGYNLVEDVILITSEDVAPSAAFRFDFLDDEHFVFYSPVTILSFLGPKEVIYLGEITDDVVSVPKK